MEKFSYEANGYNREEVNQFIGEVIQETEGMAKKYKQQQEKIDHLQDEINHYQKLEANIKDIMAEEESKKIIMDAKKEASEIINDALQRAEQIETQRKLLEKNMEIFKKKLKLIMEQQMAIVEKINELELEDK